MKVLMINGSPHAKGSTYTALSYVAEELNKNGIETEIIHVGHKDIRGCIACFKCKTLDHCIFDKDLVNEVAEKFREADGLVIGSPVYYAGPAGTLVSFLNRLFFSTQWSKRFKVGAAIASARRTGTITTLDAINKYFIHGEMPVASSRYWNEVYGMNGEEMMKDEEGKQILRVLGRNMAFFIKAIARQREAEGLPEAEPERIAYNFIRKD